MASFGSRVRMLNEAGNETAVEALKEELEGSHPQDAIAFVVVSVGIAVLVLFVTNLRYALKRQLKVFMPYTVLCFVGAFVLEIIEGTAGLGPFLGHSVRQWVSVNPELIFFVFLPALLFNDAMSLDIHLWSKKFFQAFMLAVPGVLIGTFLTAVLLQLVMPGWSWLLCVTLGAILAATDPVAVVALLTSLGAPAEVTMIITGESLLNDGVSVVLFHLVFEFYLADLSTAGDISPPIGKNRSAGKVAAFFAQEAFAAPVIGVIFGLVCLFWLRRMKRGELDDHHIGQLAITLATSYGAYYVADRVCHSSGVLACVSAGLILAWRGWPLFTDVGTIKHVWHSLEFFGNSVIFAYAGLASASAIFISGGAILLAKGALLYVVVMLVRLVTVVVLYPALWYLDRKDPIASFTDAIGFGDGMGFAEEEIQECRREHDELDQRQGDEEMAETSRGVPSVDPENMLTASQMRLIGTKKLFDFRVHPFYPSFRAFGWRDLLLTTWGGLRGAVGLVLALTVREKLAVVGDAGKETGNSELEDETRRGEELLVLYVVVCLLTLVVNAPTTPVLVKKLGIKPKRGVVERLFLHRLAAKLHDESKKDYEDMAKHYIIPPNWSRRERQFRRMAKEPEESPDAGAETLKQSGAPPCPEVTHSSRNRGETDATGAVVKAEAKRAQAEESGTFAHLVEGLRPNLMAQMESRDQVRSFASRWHRNIAGHGDGKQEAPAFEDVIKTFGWAQCDVEDGADDVETEQDKLVRELEGVIADKIKVGDLDKFLRDVFLHLVRAQYWDHLEAAVLPRGGLSTQILLHSVDHALDFTTEGLYDFDYFRFKIGRRGIGAWTLARLDNICRVLFGPVPSAAPEYQKSPTDSASDAGSETTEDSSEHDRRVLKGLLRKPMQAKYPHLARSKSNCLRPLVVQLRTLEASRQADRYFGINAYVGAHNTAQEEVLRYFGHSDAVTEHLEATIIPESKRSVAAAERFLDETIDPPVVIRERWIQLAEVAIVAKRKHLYKLHKQGVISEPNRETLDEELCKKLGDLREMRENVDRIFAKREEQDEEDEMQERQEQALADREAFLRMNNREKDIAEQPSPSPDSSGGNATRPADEAEEESKGGYDVEMAEKTD